MPEAWRVSSWGDEVVLRYGKAIRGYQHAAGCYRVFGSNGPVGWHSEALAPGPGVILGRKGAYRGVRYSREPFFVIDTAYYLEPRSQLNMRWLYYAVIHHQLGAIDDGSPIPSTTRAAVNVRRLEVPPSAEQRAIAELLGSLDDKIELNRRTNETLEAMAQAIFRDWFVDFGPTRRKMEGATDPIVIMGSVVADPERAGGLAKLFPARLEDSGLPDGWEARPLGHAFDVVMGQSPPGSTYNETGDGLPFFQGRRDFGFRFPQRRVFCSAPTRVAEADWTLISVRAPVGDINRAIAKCCIGRGVGAICHKRRLHSFTYYTALELKPALAGFDSEGTVFGSINQKQVRALPTVGSDLPVAEHFDALVSPIDTLIRSRHSEIKTLRATLDLLLPKLMSGEIRLLDTEVVTEAAE